MRRRIDMTEVETATKIRGKYLRALENEEWDLLPGPTFVKTFLRTYAEYLGLDSRLLVEEYRQRYERPSTQDLTPFTAARARGRAPRGAARRSAGGGDRRVRGRVLLGRPVRAGQARRRRRRAPPTARGEPEPTPTPAARTSAGRRSASTRRPPRVAAAARGHRRRSTSAWSTRADASWSTRLTLDPSAARARSTSRAFRTNFGNNNVRMRVNGKTYRVPRARPRSATSCCRARKPRRLSDDARPDCCVVSASAPGSSSPGPRSWRGSSATTTGHGCASGCAARRRAGARRDRRRSAGGHSRRAGVLPREGST